jgi:hypothetical protein
MWCNSLIVPRRFARISLTIFWKRSSEIEDALPHLCSSWTSVLPSENSRHHVVKFCSHNFTVNTTILFVNFRWTFILHWERVWRNAHRIWRDFGSALSFQTCLTQIKPVLPLPNEHGSQEKDQGRRQCCHTKHKKFHFRATRDVRLVSGNASYHRSI